MRGTAEDVVFALQVRAIHKKEHGDVSMDECVPQCRRASITIQQDNEDKHKLYHLNSIVREGER